MIVQCIEFNLIQMMSNQVGTPNYIDAKNALLRDMDEQPDPFYYFDLAVGNLTNGVTEPQLIYHTARTVMRDKFAQMFNVDLYVIRGVSYHAVKQCGNNLETYAEMVIDILGAVEQERDLWTKN